jgi:hypothetical protein
MGSSLFSELIACRAKGGGVPRYMDSQASDAIGIDPVQARWTVLDGADLWDVGRISGN